jgi:hypothetical protein
VLLEDLGSDEVTATPTGEWTNKVYSYDDDDHKHAETEVDANSAPPSGFCEWGLTDEENNQSTNVYRYDENGSGCCTPELFLREGQHDLPDGKWHHLSTAIQR